MTKKELETMPICEYSEEIPLLDGLYFCMSRKKHDSGYKILDIYGEKYKDENWKIKRISLGCSDVIHFKVDLQKDNISPVFNLLSIINIDCLEDNVYHVWSDYGKFYIDYRYSDFTIILKDDKACKK